MKQDISYTPEEAQRIVDEAYLTGTPFISREHMSYGGKELNPGSEINLMHGKWDARLVAQGRLVPLDEWQRILARQEYAQHRTKLGALNVKKAVAISEKQAADAALEGVKARVAQALAQVDAAEAAIREELKNAPRAVEAA